ncbi:hypothetical protein H6F88_24550 [Oculatella sp. FACHB-28]|uniref:WD40 repeat domain-containing protein n=1 Tax=Oculatella sp. FACHB-28 TaxID=2692845 RepID=UPI0016851986|nr:hypothetical protein [Oculatella sp. FACHB-28]
MLNHLGVVRGVAFHPQTHHLATGSSDRQIKLWSCATGECLATFDGHDDAIWDLGFSSSGEYLASASSDGSATHSPFLHHLLQISVAQAT